MNLSLKMIIVPTEVKRELFNKYINACRDLFSIAFMQWRLRFPNDLTYDEDEISETIESAISHHNISLMSEVKISKQTRKESTIAKDFLLKYKIIDNRGERKLSQQKPYLINGFKMIGWSDPFPDDDKKLIGSIDDEKFVSPVTIDDWVYPEYKYQDGQSPLIIYIPKKEIMLKMMRACVNVKHPHGLWINQISTNFKFK